MLHFGNILHRLYKKEFTTNYLKNFSINRNKTRYVLHVHANFMLLSCLMASSQCQESCVYTCPENKCGHRTPYIVRMASWLLKKLRWYIILRSIRPTDVFNPLCIVYMYSDCSFETILENQSSGFDSYSFSCLIQ